MTIEWVTPHWIWALIPLLLIGWWSLRRGQRPSSSRNVASLQLWDRLKVVPPPSNRWLTLLPVVMLALLSGGPRLLDSPKQKEIGWNRSITGDLRLDLHIPDGLEEIQIQSPNKPAVSLDFETIQNKTSIWLPETPPDTFLTIRCEESERTIALPASSKKTRVLYQGESPSMNSLLDALEMEGWIERAKAADPDADPIVIGPYPTNPEVSSTLPHIAFCEDGQEIFLPLIDPPLPGEPLFEGIDPGSWTVTTAFAVPEGRTLLKSSDGLSLISRTPRGFAWGFQPDSGDLAGRSDWPILMIRMLIELSNAEISEVSHSQWGFLHFTLVCTVLLTLILWALNGITLWPFLLLILCAIFLGNTTADVAWSDLSKRSAQQRQSGTFPMGTRIVFQESDPVPPPEWLQSLAEKGLGWTVGRSASVTRQPWMLTNRVVPPGSSIDVFGDIPEGDWILTSPSGAEETLVWPIQKSEPGIWSVIGPDGKKDSFLIRSPIPVTLALSEYSSLESLFQDPRFKTSLLNSSGSLPDPRAGSVLAWHGQTLPEPILTELPSWIESGGVLFAVSGDHDCDDDRTLAVLEEVLSAPLPPMEDQDLDMGVILLDLSGSLIGESATTLLESTLAILDTSHTGLRWGVAGFRTGVEWLLEPGTLVGSGTAGLLEGEIRSGGGTRLGNALQQITPDLIQHEGSKRLLVLTDGRTVPANWTEIGKNLAAAGIQLEILLIGESVDRNAAEELTRSSGGSLNWAATTTGAIDKISAWIPEDLPGWKKTTPPLIQNEGSPLVSGLSAPLSLPRQILDPGESESNQHTATEVWTDRGDNMILSSHSSGLGQALLWWSSFESSRLGESTSPLIQRLRDVLATAAGRKAQREIASGLFQSPNGMTSLALERKFGEAATLGPVDLSSTNSQWDELALVSDPGKKYFKTEEFTQRETVHWTTGSLSGIATEIKWREIESHPWLGISSTRKPSPGGQPWPPLLIVAALVWISSRGRQR